MTGLAKIEQTGLSIREEPRLALPDIFRLAAELQKAQGFLPRHLQNPGQIAAVILAGQELGIPAMAAIRGIKLVQGSVTLDAALQLGLMNRCGIRHEWLEQTATCAKLKLERPGFAPHIQTFTIEDAKQAELTKGDNWKKYPAAMLRARCVSAAGKAFAADILHGVYLPDELEHIDEPRRSSKPVRSLDDVAREDSRRAPTQPPPAQEGGPAPLATSTSTTTTPSTMPTRTASTEVTDAEYEYDPRTGEIGGEDYTFERHLSELTHATTSQQLGEWLSLLGTFATLTDDEKAHARQLFKEQCKKHRIDMRQFATAKE